MQKTAFLKSEARGALIKSRIGAETYVRNVPAGMDPPHHPPHPRERVTLSIVRRATSEHVSGKENRTGR